MNIASSLKANQHLSPFALNMFLYRNRELTLWEYLITFGLEQLQGVPAGPEVLIVIQKYQASVLHQRFYSLSLPLRVLRDIEKDSQA
jgi:fucose permease